MIPKQLRVEEEAYSTMFISDGSRRGRWMSRMFGPIRKQKSITPYPIEHCHATLGLGFGKLKAPTVDPKKTR